MTQRPPRSGAIAELRSDRGVKGNAANQATRQWVWGPGGTGILPVSYVDELILMDVNGDPTESNDCDPDDQAGESTADERYFYVQDRQPLTQRRPPRGHGRSATAELCSGRCVKGNWNVVALTGYDPTGEGGGDVVERYSYTPYGEFIVLNTATSELGNVLPTSTVGNPLAFQGLYHDNETDTDQQRWRQRGADRFMQRDPLGYVDGNNLYAYLGAAPTVRVDPHGLAVLLGSPCAWTNSTWCCYCAQTTYATAAATVTAHGYSPSGGGLGNALAHCMWACQTHR